MARFLWFYTPVVHLNSKIKALFGPILCPHSAYLTLRFGENQQKPFQHRMYKTIFLFLILQILGYMTKSEAVVIPFNSVLFI